MATAWLAGASGLVGRALLQRLLQDDYFGTVVSVGRRALSLQHPKLTQLVTDFSSPSEFEALIAPDIGFSCLGTTIRKAGSREAFRKVDHDAVWRVVTEHIPQMIPLLQAALANWPEEDAP